MTVNIKSTRELDFAEQKKIEEIMNRKSDRFKALCKLKDFYAWENSSEGCTVFMGAGGSERNYRYRIILGRAC